MRDTAAHRAFRQAALAKSERVFWRFPEVKVENRIPSIKDVTAYLSTEPDHPVSREVARLFAVYRDQLLKDLEAHEKRYNKGCMPEVTIVREHEPSCGVEAAAMHCFACAWHDVIVDATEEDPLLNPA